MIKKVLRPDGGQYSIKGLEDAFKAYKREKNMFQAMQLKAKNNLEQELKFTEHLAEKRYKNNKEFADERDLYLVKKFSNTLKLHFEKKQMEELKRFNKHLEEIYTHCFNSLYKDGFKLDISDKDLKKAIKLQKVKVAQEKKQRVNDLKKQEHISFVLNNVT